MSEQRNRRTVVYVLAASVILNLHLFFTYMRLFEVRTGYVIESTDGGTVYEMVLERSVDDWNKWRHLLPFSEPRFGFSARVHPIGTVVALEEGLELARRDWVAWADQNIDELMKERGQETWFGKASYWITGAPGSVQDQLPAQWRDLLADVLEDAAVRDVIINYTYLPWRRTAKDYSDVQSIRLNGAIVLSGRAASRLHAYLSAPYRRLYEP